MKMNLKTNPDDPVTGLQDTSYCHGTEGITKREYFAAAALQGLCSSPNAGKYSPRSKAEEAVITADALIEALNKEKSCT